MAEVLLRSMIPPDLTEIDQLLKEGDVLRWGSFEAQVIHTPGHTPGSVSLYLPHEAGKISTTKDARPPAANRDGDEDADSAEESGDSEESEKIDVRLPQLFSGDTLFAGSIGCTDFWGGSLEAIMDSLRSKLMHLPDETIVHPGHGPMTTIGHERQLNPFLQPE